MSRAIGIDLGTSNSAAAIMEGGRPVIIPSAEGTSLGGKAFPSYVAFTKDGQRLVGEPARRQAAINPDGTIQAAKRKMGTDFKFKVYGKEYAPHQISAFILQKIKQDAEAYLGETVNEAVITVPAYFNDNQRQATKDAGEIAGLKVLRIVNEPTSACLAYGLDKADKEQKIMVFDLGGGTLDVTIMDMAQGVFEVKATSGDTQLGGTDMDQAILDWIAREFQQETGLDLRKDPMAVQRVREAGEKAKIELSSAMQTDINLPFITADHGGPKPLAKTFPRAKLEEIINPIIERCRHPVEQALNDAKMSPADIDKIILVGGPTRMPIVKRFLEEVVGKKVERGVDPMECVAMGAAIQAGVLKGEVKDVLLLDVTPLSLGIETLGSVNTVLITRNTTIPSKKSQTFSTAADFQQAVDIKVYQGERPMAKDNVLLGEFQLLCIPPAPRGVPQIEVSFDIDANGIMHVGAKDLGTGKEQKMRITAPTKMNKDEIEKKMKEAEEFAEQDKKTRELVETKNEAESLIYTAEKTIADLKDKLPKDKVEAIENASKKLKETISSDNVGRIRSENENLKKVLQEAGSYIYQQAGAQGGDTGPKTEDVGPGAGDDKTVDADYEKVDDDKK